MQINLERVQEAKIGSLVVNPALQPKFLEDATQGADAFILIGYASGGTPEILNDVIRKRTTEGVPIFIVSDNRKNDHGILNPRKYDVQAKSLDAGAIPIQSINVNKIVELAAAIKKAFAEGKRGTELGKAIQQQFSLSEEELKRLGVYTNV